MRRPPKRKKPAGGAVRAAGSPRRRVEAPERAEKRGADAPGPRPDEGGRRGEGGGRQVRGVGSQIRAHPYRWVALVAAAVSIVFSIIGIFAATRSPGSFAVFAVVAIIALFTIVGTGIYNIMTLSLPGEQGGGEGSGFPQIWRIISEGQVATISVDRSGSFTGSGWTGTAERTGTKYNVYITRGLMSESLIAFEEWASYSGGQGSLVGSGTGTLNAPFPHATHTLSGTSTGTISDPFGTASYSRTWTATKIT